MKSYRVKAVNIQVWVAMGVIVLTAWGNKAVADQGAGDNLPSTLYMISAGSEYSSEVADCINTPDSGKQCKGKEVVFTVAESNVKTYFRTTIHASCFPVGLELVVSDEASKEILREVYPPSTRGGFFTAKTRRLRQGRVYQATWSAFSVGPFSGCQEDEGSEHNWYGALKIRESGARYLSNKENLTQSIVR